MAENADDHQVSSLSSVTPQLISWSPDQDAEQPQGAGQQVERSWSAPELSELELFDTVPSHSSQPAGANASSTLLSSDVDTEPRVPSFVRGVTRIRQPAVETAAVDPVQRRFEELQASQVVLISEFRRDREEFTRQLQEVRLQLADVPEQIAVAIRQATRMSGTATTASELAIASPPVFLFSNGQRTYHGAGQQALPMRHEKVNIEIFDPNQVGFLSWARTVKSQLANYNYTLVDAKRKLLSGITGQQASQMFEVIDQLRNEGKDHLSDQVSWEQFIALIAPVFGNEESALLLEQAWREVRQCRGESADDYIKRKSSAFRRVDRIIPTRYQVQSLVDGLDSNLRIIYAYCRSSQAEQTVIGTENAIRAAERALRQQVDQDGYDQEGQRQRE